MVDANPIHSPVAFTCICTCHECDASPATNRPAPFGDHSLCARHFKGTPLLGKFLQHLCVHSPAGSFPNSFYYASRKTLPNGCVTFLHHRQRPLSQAPVAERPVVLPPATRERAMPIRPFLDGHIFDPETTRLMGICIRNGSCGSSSTPPSPPHRRSNRREDHRACEIRRAQCRCFV